MFNTRSSKQMSLWGIGIIIFIVALVLLFRQPSSSQPIATAPTPTPQLPMVAPTSTTQPTATPPEATPAYPPLHAELAHANLDQPLLVADKIYETESGYILTGVQQSIDITDDIRIYASQHVTNFVVVDRNGNEIPFKSTMDFPFEVSTTNYSPWGVKIDQKDIAWPVTVTLEEAEIRAPDPIQKFTLDVGENPAEDQVWEINKTFESCGYYAKLISIGRIPGGYEYTFERGPQVINVGAGFEGDYQIDHGQGRITEDGLMINGTIYEEPLPVGELTVMIMIQEVMITGPWVVTFEQPQQ